MTTATGAAEPADPGFATGHRPSDASALVHDLPELVRLTGHSTLEDLCEEIYDSFELDAWIPPPEEQEDEPDMLLIRMHDRGVSLPYPFPVEDLWDAINDMEDEISARWKAESEAEDEAERAAR